MCIDTAFNEGLPMDNPPAPAMMTPKRRGNSAVTYPVAAKNPIPRVPIIPPASTDNCGMLKPAMVYLDMTLDSRLNILYRVWEYNDWKISTGLADLDFPVLGPLVYVPRPHVLPGLAHLDVELVGPWTEHS